MTRNIKFHSFFSTASSQYHDKCSYIECFCTQWSFLWKAKTFSETFWSI